MTFRLPDCILTWIFTPRRLFGLVDLSYVFSGSCLPLATGWTLRMFNARFSLRGNRITKKQIWCCCALHYGIRLSLWRTACLYRKPALLRLPKSSQRTSKSAWFSLPYSLRCTRKWHEKLSPHSSYSTTLTFHICSHTWPKYSLHTSQCSYLTLLHLNVIIYLPPSTLNLDFFRKVVRNQTPRAYIRDFCHRTASIRLSCTCIPTFNFIFLFYHNLWTAILSIKAVEALKHFFPYQNTFTYLALYPYLKTTGMFRTKILPLHCLGPVLYTDWVGFHISSHRCTLLNILQENDIHLNRFPAYLFRDTRTAQIDETTGIYISTSSATGYYMYVSAFIDNLWNVLNHCNNMKFMYSTGQDPSLYSSPQ